MRGQRPLAAAAAPATTIPIYRVLRPCQFLRGRGGVRAPPSPASTSARGVLVPIWKMGKVRLLEMDEEGWLGQGPGWGLHCKLWPQGASPPTPRPVINNPAAFCLPSNSPRGLVRQSRGPLVVSARLKLAQAPQGRLAARPGQWRGGGEGQGRPRGCLALGEAAAFKRGSKGPCPAGCGSWLSPTLWAACEASGSPGF